jgi:ATP-dependent DNA ligase
MSDLPFTTFLQCPPAKAPFPGFIAPALATLQSGVPVGAVFVHEIKLDGYRLQPHIRDGKIPDCSQWLSHTAH